MLCTLLKASKTFLNCVTLFINEIGMKRWATEIVECFAKCNYDKVVQILELGFPVNYNLTQRGGDGRILVAKTSLLHLACEHGQGTLVETIIQHGADIENIDSFKRTPVLIACEMGYVDIIKILIPHGANIQARDYDGNTALHIAAVEGKLNVVRYLVEDLNIGVNIKNNQGLAPLQACESKCYSSLHEVQWVLDEVMYYLRSYINPAKGSLVMFRNQTEAGQPDRLSVHSECKNTYQQEILAKVRGQVVEKAILNRSRDSIVVPIRSSMSRLQPRSRGRRNIEQIINQRSSIIYQKYIKTKNSFAFPEPSSNLSSKSISRCGSEAGFALNRSKLA